MTKVGGGGVWVVMGYGRIFLKSLCDTSFNKDLSNEPNFGRLAGQYLQLPYIKATFHTKHLIIWLDLANLTKKIMKVYRFS